MSPETVGGLAVVMVVGGEPEEVVAPVRRRWSAALGLPVRLAGTPAALRAAGGVWEDDIVVRLPAGDDRYVRTVLGVAPWRGMGRKSGPNLQWAMTLDLLAEAGLDWVLLLEPDVVPADARAARAVRLETAAHPAAWVIGARPHPSLRSRLDPDLHDHLNGVALYRVGGDGFRTFLHTAWIPSLVWTIRRTPHLAFDCLTAVRLQERLPDHLRDAWHRERHRFVATAGMVNLSTHPDGAAMAEAVLGDETSDEGPWLVHARTLRRTPSVRTSR